MSLIADLEKVMYEEDSDPLRNSPEVTSQKN